MEDIVAWLVQEQREYSHAHAWLFLSMDFKKEGKKKIL